MRIRRGIIGYRREDVERYARVLETELQLVEMNGERKSAAMAEERRRLEAELRELELKVAERERTVLQLKQWIHDHSAS